MSADPPILRTSDLRKTYRLGRVRVPVLRGASVEVREGEWLAILGASGSGKSTLLHLMGDLDRPDAGDGTVAYRGRSVGAMTLDERAAYRNEEVGFVFQFYHLLPELTVLENAMLPGLVTPSLRPWWHWAVAAAGGAAIGGGAAWGAIEAFGPAGWAAWLKIVLAAGGGVLGAAASIPVVTEVQGWALRFGARRRALKQEAVALLKSFGLGHRLRHRPRELSGGERQRVAIARALINRPEILLADEPTGNLDEATGREILDLLAAQHRAGLTIVMVTHDEKVAARADRVVRLQDGAVAGASASAG